MSSAPYPVVQKLTSTRRRTRAPARRFRFLVGEGTLRREGSVFSSEDPCSGETTPVSRRRGRVPTRKFRFLAGECELRRKDCIFSSMAACSDETIAFSRSSWHPARFLRPVVGHIVIQVVHFDQPVEL